MLPQNINAEKYHDISHNSKIQSKELHIRIFVKKKRYQHRGETHNSKGNTKKQCKVSERPQFIDKFDANCSKTKGY